MNIFKGMSVLTMLMLGGIAYIAYMSWENKKRIAATNLAVNGSSEAKA